MSSDMDFNDAVEAGVRWIVRGHIINQKFTCKSCGSRQTMAQTNRFFQTGKCEECKYETDLVKQGCGYLVSIQVPQTAH